MFVTGSAKDAKRFHTASDIANAHCTCEGIAIYFSECLNLLAQEKDTTALASILSFSGMNPTNSSRKISIIRTNWRQCIC